MLVCRPVQRRTDHLHLARPRAAGRGAGGGGQPAREHGRQLGRLHRSHRRGNRPSEGDDARSAVRPRRRGKPGEHRHGRRRNGTPGRIDVQGVHVGRSHRTGHLASDAGRLHLSPQEGTGWRTRGLRELQRQRLRHPDDPKRDGHLVEHRLPAPVELDRPGIHYRDGQPPGRDLPHAARVHRNRGRGRRQSVGDGERLRHAGQRRRETRAHGDHKDPRPRRQRHLASGGERHRRTRVGREGRRRHDEGVGNGVHAEQRHGHVGAVEQRAAGCRQDGHRQLVHRPLAGGLYAQPVVRGLDRRPVRRY